MVPIAAARALAAGIPGARLIELPGDDHIPIVDPDQIVDEVEEFLTGHRTEREPDRMLATVMFTDIVDSTKRAVELGPARWRDTVANHNRSSERVIDAYHGRLIKTTGDGVIAVFDSAERAVRAARSIRIAVEALGLRIRAAVHSGELEVTDDDVRGIAVHTAARILNVAGPGEILASATLMDLVDGADLTFEDAGAHQLKGLKGARQLYRLA
jgi:class 3 adenylate cyclase